MSLLPLEVLIDAQDDLATARGRLEIGAYPISAQKVFHSHLFIVLCDYYKKDSISVFFWGLFVLFISLSAFIQLAPSGLVQPEHVARISTDVVVFCAFSSHSSTCVVTVACPLSTFHLETPFETWRVWLLYRLTLPLNLAGFGYRVEYDGIQ